MRYAALVLAAAACSGGAAASKPAPSPALAARFPLAALDDAALCERLLARTPEQHAVVVDPEPIVRRTVIVSDLHLGPGTSEPRYAGIEDFYAGAAWAAFLADQGARGPTDLVVAGDFIEFWQIAAARGDLPAATGAEQTPGARVLASDQAASLAQLAPVLVAHAGVFDALGAFLAAGDHRVVILAGNHDANLLWPRVQLAIAQAIDPADPARLVFVDGAAYEHAGVHVAHGHAYDLANRLDTAHAPFGVDAAGTCRLQTSWGEIFVDKFYTETERQLPFIDNLYPVSAGVLWGMKDEPEPVRDVGAVLRFLELVRMHETKALNREALGGLLQEALGMPGANDRGPESLDDVMGHVADQMLDGDANALTITDALLRLKTDPALAGLWPAVVKSAVALPDVRAAFAALRAIDKEALVHLRALVLGDSLTTAATRVLRERPGVSVVVFGHTHQVGGAVAELDAGGVRGYYANTGSWLSVASVAELRARGVRFADIALDAATFPSKTTAVIVEYDGGVPRAPVVYNAPAP
jgi:UDP-2,3-diacylglucosamine pyrophosphatase LpxH